MERLRAALKALATTYAATLCSILLTLVIAPLYIRHLGLEQMGLLAVGQAIAGYLTLANGGLSTSTMILVSHAKGRDDWFEVAKVLRHSLILSAAIISLVAVFTLLLVTLIVRVPSVRHLLGLDHPDLPTLIGLVGVQVMVAMAFSSFYDLLAGLQENHRASVFQGINRIVGQIVSAIVAVRAGTAASVIAASVFVTVCMGLVCVVDTWRRHARAFRKTPIEFREFVAQVRTGLKSFGIQVGATMGGYAPVAAINHVAGPAMVPTFTLPNQIISLAAGVIGSFGGVMLPVFGEAWAKGDLAWIQMTLTKLLEKLLLLLAAASAGFLALGGPFLKVWVHMDIPLLMLVSVTLIACSTNVIAFLKFMLSAINRHRVAAISELLNGALTLVMAFVVCRFSIDAVGIGVALSGCATSYWLLPGEIRRHLGISRIMPGPRSLAIILGVAFTVYAAAGLGLAVLHRLLHVPPIGAILVAAVFGSFVFLKASSATGILDWQSVLTRLVSPASAAEDGGKS